MSQAKPLTTALLSTQALPLGPQALQALPTARARRPAAEADAALDALATRRSGKALAAGTRGRVTDQDEDVPAEAGEEGANSEAMTLARDLAESPTTPDATLLAQLDTPATTPPAASSAGQAATAAPAAAAGEPLSVMTPATTVLGNSPTVTSLLGAAPIGAVASGAVLLGLALGGGGGGSGNASGADTTGPSLVSAVTNADGSKLILTYSEAVSSTVPDKSAFAVTADGTPVTVSNVARGSDMRTLELTLVTPITALKTALLSYTAPTAAGAAQITDAAGNHAGSYTAQAVTVNDSSAPTLLGASAFTSSEATHVVLTYSEPLLASHSPAASAYTVGVDNVASPVSAVEVLGNQVRLTLQNKIASGGGAAITVAYTAPTSDNASTNAAVQDLAGQDAAAINPPRLITGHRFDSSAPTVSGASINAAGNSISLTLSEALDANQTAAASAYAVQVTDAGSIRSVPVASVSVLGSVVTLNLAEPVSSSTASVQLSYTAPASSAALQDLAGNHVGSIGLQAVVNSVDTTAPTLGLANFKSSKTLALSFNEALGSSTAEASAFTVLTGGVANPVTAVKVNGSTLELSLTNAVATGQATTWAYSAPTANRATSNAAVQDSAGNDLASVSTRTLDTTAPTLASAATGSTGTQVVLTFNEAMQASSYPGIGAFQVLGSQSGVRAVSSVAASGNVVTLTLASSLLATETVSLSYAAPAADIATSNLALQDLAGNDLASLGATLPLTVTNKIAPVLTSQSLALDTSGQFKQVVLGFSESLAATSTPASAFAVTADGAAQAVSTVAVSGSAVTLTLANPLSSSAALAVAYTVPGSNPLADSDANPATAFAATSLGRLNAGTSGADTLTGTSGIDYFLGSLGNDTLTGAGGADTFAWPTLASPAGMSDTLKDFGLKSGTGTLQGSSEADVLDLRYLLSGYQAAKNSEFLQFGKDSNGKLLLHIDHDGGSSFQADASLVFDNISVNSSNQLLVNTALVPATATGLSGSLTLSNVQAQWEADHQLRVL